MEIFREKSIERITSPEQLNDYIRVTTTPGWLFLLAMAILLAGIVVWACFGKISVREPNGTIQTETPITFIEN